MWIATSEHTRAIDRRTTEEFGIPASVLMERAGLAVFDVLKEMLPEGGRITVFSGKGNNGGDAFVTARAALDAGFKVDSLVAADEADLSRDCALQLRIAQAHGLVPIFRSDARWDRKIEQLGGQDLIIDGLLGIGGKSAVRGSVKEAIEAINRSGVPVLAIDVPSGIDADTGEELGESVWALRTVTFGLPKPYLFEGIGLEHAGYWTVHEIGIPAVLLAGATNAILVDKDWVGCMMPERMRSAHKGDAGAVLIVAGSDAYRGAAVLSAIAAIRSGAGTVTVAAIPSVCAAVAAQVPEAILLVLPERDGHVDPAGAELVLGVNKVHAAVFGPGLGQGDDVQEFLARIWANWHRPCVVDADALNAVSSGVRLPDTEWILTPHPGEMSRLLQLSIAEIQSDRFQTVQHAAERFGGTVLLKGAYSVAAHPGQPIRVNSNGNPGLATGGTGDVLSGVLGTLLAQDLPPFCAAAVGAYWHGAAGDRCAEEIGPIGFSAGDVARALPQARAKIIKCCHAH